MWKNLKTQKQIKEYARSVINQIGVCSSINDFHPTHLDFFHFMFSRHPSFPEKFEDMIDIAIQFNPQFKTTLEVVIKKDDGTMDDVSFLVKCVLWRRIIFKYHKNYRQILSQNCNSS
jgi:hypothetical protein